MHLVYISFDYGYILQLSNAFTGKLSESIYLSSFQGFWLLTECV